MSGAYERGYAAGLKAAAEVCKSYAKGRNAIAADPNERRRIRNSATTLALAAEYCANEILSLPIVGEATNPGEQVAENHKGAPDVRASARPGPSQECVIVPVEELKIVLDFFRKANWPDTRAGNAAYRLNSAMLAAAKEEHDAHR